MSNSDLAIISLKDFQFNDEICVFEPYTLYDNSRCTLVTEKQREYLVSASTRRVINRCCSTFGTSLEECTRLSKEVTGAANKLPISFGTMDSPTVLFPTLSPDRAYTSWVVLEKITRFSIGAATNAIIFFDGDKKFNSQISTSSLNSQIARSFVIKQHYSSINPRTLKNIDLTNFTKIDRKAISKL